MEQTSVASNANGNSPGARLRSARTARGLSLDDVAQSLRLSPRIIAALEDDAYEQLPSPTYVRGYVRSYAMLLGLPPQPLIDAFNSQPQAARPVEMVSPTPARETSSSDAMVRFGTLIVVALVIGLSVLWWSGQSETAPERESSATATTGDALPAEEAELAASSAELEPAEAPAAPTEAPAPEQPAAPVAAAPVTAPPPVAAVDPNAPRVRLRLRLSEDSWADVRDAGQRRLLYETLAAGRVVELEGVAPLSVFLGNVEGVQVEVDGQPYDAMRHKRGEVARFTLGARSGT